MVSYFIVVSLLNNIAPNFHIPMPLHMIFRSVSYRKKLEMVASFVFVCCVYMTICLFLTGFAGSQFDFRNNYLKQKVIYSAEKSFLYFIGYT